MNFIVNEKYMGSEYDTIFTVTGTCHATPENIRAYKPIPMERGFGILEGKKMSIEEAEEILLPIKKHCGFYRKPNGMVMISNMDYAQDQTFFGVQKSGF